MDKKVWMLLLTIVMIVSVAGCSGKKENVDPNSAVENIFEDLLGKDSEPEEEPAGDETEESEPAEEAMDEEAPMAEGGYQEGALFQFGMTPVELEDGSYGYMNVKGQWVIEPQYDKASAFGPDGVAVVYTMDGVQQLIDTKGAVVAEPGLDAIGLYMGPVFSPCGIATAMSGDQYGYLYKDASGYEFKAIEGAQTCWDFNAEGYATVDMGDGTSGILNSSMEWVIEPHTGLDLNYEAFVNGLCSAADMVNEKCGYIDIDGNWVITADRYDPDYSLGALAFADNGLAVVEDSVIDRTGAEVFNLNDVMEGSASYDVSVDFCDSIWLRMYNVDDTKSYRFVNEKGEYMCGTSSHDYSHTNNDNPVMVANRLCIKAYVTLDANDIITGVVWDGSSDEDRWVVIDENLEYVFSPYEKDYGPMDNYYTDGYAVVELDDDLGIFGFVDTEGNLLYQNDESMPIDGINQVDRFN